MRSHRILLVALVFVPSVAVAQRGGGGGGGGKRLDPPKASDSGQRLATARDYEELNPATLLVDKRKKLALADSTVNQLKALEKAIKERNKQPLAMYDSVRKRINNSVTAATPELQMESSQNTLGLRNLVTQMRDQRTKDVEEAMTLVPDAQRKQAGEFLKDQSEEFDRISGSGRGGRRG